jgi:cold shock protein
VWVFLDAPYLWNKSGPVRVYVHSRCELAPGGQRGQVMKIGTVRWFSSLKGYGFIHPDDGSPNILVHRSAVESAGMSDLKGGQRIIFETQPNERTGEMSAVSLKALAPAVTTHLDRSFATTNPFDIISAFILSAMSPLMRP